VYSQLTNRMTSCDWFIRLVAINRGRSRLILRYILLGCWY